MKSVAELEAEHRAWADSKQVISRCLADGCAWTFEGTAAEGRHAHAEHRAQAHPGSARPSKRRREKQFFEKQAERRREDAAKGDARARNGRAVKWTRETIVAAIQEFHAEHGRPPTSTEWKTGNVGRYPMLKTVQREFGRWSAAIEAAGFEPGKAGRRPSSGAAGVTAPSLHHTQGAEPLSRPVSAPDPQPDPEPSRHGPIACHVADHFDLDSIRDMLAHAERRAQRAQRELAQAHGEILTLLEAASIHLEKPKAA